MTAAQPRRLTAGFGLFLALVLLAARVAHLHDPLLVLDDAYITFRYAENLAEGRGFVFNPGERVEGSTSFLWTVVLALAHAVGWRPPAASVALAFAAAAGIVIVIARWGGRAFGASRLPTLLAALLFAGSATTARFVVSGLETLPFAALVSLGLYWVIARPRPIAAGVAFAASFLVRPEGLAYFLVAIVAGAILQRGSWTWRRCAETGGIVLVTTLALEAFRLAYFGSLLPNTFYAKAGGLSLDRLAQGWRVAASQPDGWGLWFLVVPAALALALGPRRPWMWAAGAVFLAGVAEFVLVGGDFLPFFGPRFLTPGIPGLALLASAGVIAFADRLTKHRRQAAFILAAALLGGSIWWSWPCCFSRLPGLAMTHRAWRETGLWLHDHAPKGSIIATGAAGLIPYLSRLQTVDMYGLTDPHIARRSAPPTGFRMPAHERYDPGYVLDRKVDYIFSRIDPAGTPVTAGLRTVRRRLLAEYEMVLQVRDRTGSAPGEAYLAPVEQFSRDLWGQGFQSALFRRQ